MGSLLIDALHCRNKARPPVWLMRQAGRYMPEYRAIREKHSFLEMCHTPELAAEITLLPIQAFAMDAAILFSDILVIPEAMGVGVRFEEGRGPVIDSPLQNAKDIENLPAPPVEEALGYVSEAIKLLVPQLKVPLLGFSGAPFTLASYMIEGGGGHDLKKTKQWMLKDPESFHRLLETLADYIIAYLKMQVGAGVQAVQIFDSWANVLAFRQFEEFSLRYLRRILEGIKETGIPAILFCRGSSVFARAMAGLNPRAVSLDWNVDLLSLREQIPSHVALQGNLDPDILYASADVIKREVQHLLRGMRSDPGYIFNLGHGIKPDIPVDSVKTLVEVIKSST